LRLPTRRAEVAPLQRPQPRSEAPDTVNIELDRLQGLHVLIVEDDTDSRNVLALLLQKLGALVEAVPSAKEAMARVVSRRPDVIVSDIGMPEEDGYSLIRRLRQLPADLEKKLPAIALTAYARKQDADAAIDAGYDRHLPKPVAPAELIRAIKSVVVPS
jgi:CheY-like chemotaxis protein